MVSAVNGEQVFVENAFGTVTNKRVVYYRDKGWFSGGSREDIPLQHVTSVRLDTHRNVVAGIVFLLIGLGSFSGGDAGVVVGLLFLILAFFSFWGSPKVVVNTSGRDLNAAKGFPWDRKKANEFVDVLRHQLFSRP